MHDSRVTPRVPLRILCQHEAGSCAACCGVYNFVDRSPAAMRARLRRRTALVRAAWPEPERLREARDTLLALEAPELLFGGVKVCPFAGYVDSDGDGDDASSDRIGCLLHPTRHPTGEDLRDLAVYPKEVCAGHFCAPHDWLRPVEADLAQTARGATYGRVVTDAGLVKGVARLLADAIGRPPTAADVARASDALADLWHFLLEAWPFVDPDPRRFGGFAFSGDDAVERTLPGCLAGLAVQASTAERNVLDGIGTRSLREGPDVPALDCAPAALAALRQSVAAVAAAMVG
jgi:hypothetical protein